MSLRLNQILGGADIRSPIFYDSDDTNFYANPAGESKFNYLRLTNNNALYFTTTGVAELNNEGNSTNVAFRMIKSGSSNSDSNNYGVLNLQRTNHTNAATNAGASIFFELKDSGGTIREYAGISGCKTEAGAAGGRLIFHRYARTEVGFWDADQLYSSSSVRTPIFYDSDNTGYYLNPAGNSQVVSIYANDWFRAQGNTGLYFQDKGYGITSAGAASNSYGNASTYGSGLNGWQGWGIGSRHCMMSTGGDNFGIHDNTRSWLYYWNGTYHNFQYGYLQSDNSVRGPLFYDSNNTAYYLDPANTGTSLLVAGNVGIGTVSPGAPLEVSGVSGDGVPTFKITSTSAPASFNYAGTMFNSSLGASKSYSLMIGKSAASKNSGYIGYNHSGTDGSNTNFLTFGHFQSDYLLNILGNGNVGIGTTSPTQILDVRGNIKLGGDNSGNYVYYVTDIERTIVRTTRSDVTQEGLLRSDGWGNFTFSNNIGVGLSLGTGYGVGSVGAGIVYANGSVRAPIFYDSNDTNYYVDAASTSVLNRLKIDGGNFAFDYFQSLSDFISGTLVTTDIPATAAEGESFVMNVVGKSYSASASPFNFTVQGYLYSSTIINFSGIKLDSTGLTSVKIFENGGVLCFWWPTISYWNAFEVSVRAYNSAKNNYNRVTNITNSTEPVGTKKVTVTLQSFLRADVSATNSVDLRAPIFYDSNNTAYYLDPASTSALYDLTLIGAKHTYLNINPGNGWEAMVRYNGGSGSGWYAGKRIASQLVGTESFHFYSEAAGATVGGIDTSGNLFSTGSMRSPIFYDNNNTAYYLDPASTSILDATRHNNIVAGSTSGMSSSGAIAVYSGASPYISFHDGTTARTAYFQELGGRFYFGEVTYTESEGSFRAPIFYDSNNTAYYVDPASTGYSAYFAGAIQATKIGIEDGGLDCYMEITDANPSVYGVGYGGEFIFYGDKSTPASFLYYGGATVTYTLQANSSLRSPIFYDSNNTDYYLDPASTSRLNTLNVVGVVSGARGVFSDSSGSGSAVIEAYNTVATNGTTAIFRQTTAGGNGNQDIGLLVDIQGAADTDRIANFRYYNGSTYTSRMAIMRGGNVGIGTTSPSQKLHVSGIGYSDTDFRAPIFYDSNNTAYYIDPNGASIINTITSVQYYTSGWFRNNGSGNGLYNESTGEHFYSDAADMWNVASANNTQGIRLRTGGYNGTIRGYFYADSSNNVGLLNQDGNWRVRVVGGDYALFDGSSVRAPLFYDSNDTAYYLDPAGTSNLNKLSTFTMSYNDMNSMHVQSPYATRYGGSTGYRNGTMGHGTTDCNVMFSNWGSGFIDSWSNPANAPGGSTHYVGLQGFHFNNQNSVNAYGFQMLCAGEADNRFFWRSAWPTLRSWVEMIHSGNIASQTVATAGSCTGNAATVTNGVYTGTTNNITGQNYFLSNLGTTSGAINSAPLQASSTGTNAAFMSFHRQGNYAVNFGLDSDNVLRIGGWSAPANRLQLDMSGNLTLAGVVDATQFRDSSNTAYYVDPASTSNLVGLTVANTITGSISGNAATATTSLRSTIEDTRAAQRTPNDYDDYRASYEFTNAITGLGDWHSAFTLQGWHNGYAAWQIIGPASTSAHENFYLRSGVNTTWNAVRTILHSGNYNSYSPTLTGTGASGTWSINVTGNAATATSATTINATSDITVNSVNIGKGGGDIATNSRLGINALSNNTTGTGNSAFGASALLANTSGYSNGAFGRNALLSNTYGIKNYAFGSDALRSNTFGSYSIAIGQASLYSNTTGEKNVAIGDQALYDTTFGMRNVAIGYWALKSNVTGNDNNAVGYLALNANTTGHRNNAFGGDALRLGAVCSDNSAFGHFALRYSSGNNNCGFGTNAGLNITTGTNSNCFGYNSQPSSASASNQITLGNSSISTLRCQVTTITALSDERDKTDIESLDIGLDFITKLKPVTFKWDKREWYDNGIRDGSKKENILQVGFIAQDLKKVQEETETQYLRLVLEDNKDKLEATPGNLLIPLIKAVQELNEKVKTLENKVRILENR